MIRKIVIGTIAAMSVFALCTPVYAHEGHDESRSPKLLVNVERTVESTVRNTEETTKTIVDDSSANVKDRLKSQREQIKARKTELTQELKQKMDDRKEQLEGQRLAQCQNRQSTINQLIDKSASNGKDRLARIQRFEEGLKAFYAKHQLDNDLYATALSVADQKEAAAIAALESMDSQEFDCLKIDGADSSDTIRSARETKRVALTQYRDSVSELLKIVKQTFVNKTESKQ